MIGYIVVRTPGALKIADPYGGVTSVYSGLDREPWECVDDMYYDKTLASELIVIRERSRKNYVGNYSPGTVQTVHEAFQLLSACKNDGQESEVVGIADLCGSETQFEPVDAHGILGLDCYIDGYGSLLTLGIFNKPEIFRDFHSYLNPYGLFESVDTVRQYSKIYCERSEFAKLEPIDDLNNMYIYAVFPVKRA